MIEVKLYNEPNETWTAEQQVLFNRGLPIEDQERWKKASLSELYGGEELDVAKMLKIAADMMYAIENNKNVGLIVDCDCDGYTSSAIIYNYFYDRFEEGTKKYLHFRLHEGKQHGINDMLDKIDYDNFGGLIVPDAGSNDLDAMRQVVEDSGNEDCFIDILD